MMQVMHTRAETAMYMCTDDKKPNEIALLLWYNERKYHGRRAFLYGTERNRI